MKNTDFITYIHGGGDTAWRRSFEEWREESPVNEKEFSDFKKIWESLEVFHGDYNPDVEKAWERHLDQTASIKLIIRKKALRRFIRVAAAILIILSVGSGTVFTIRNLNEFTNQTEFITQDEIKKVTLPDQSEVWLNRNSRVILSREFNRDKRRIKLEGEAFFQVSKDSEHPFSVLFNKSAVRVIGTSFDIKCYKDENKLSVVVKEGKVAFYKKHNRQRNFILTAGQKVGYLQVEGIVERSEVDPRNYLAWQTRQFRFVDTDINEVFNILGDFYGENYELEDDVSEDLALSGNFSVESREEIIEAIELTFDLEIISDSTANYIVRKPN